MTNTSFLFLKYMIVFLTVTFVRPEFPQKTGRCAQFSQPEDVLSPIFIRHYVVLPDIFYIMHPLCQRKPKLAQSHGKDRQNITSHPTSPNKSGCEEGGFFSAEILAASFFGRWQGSVSVRASPPAANKRHFCHSTSKPGRPHFIIFF